VNAAMTTAVSGSSQAALLLSGGRDSASLAVSASRQNLPVSTVTLDLDADPRSETRVAHELAENLGLAWSAVPVATDVSERELKDFLSLAATPLIPPAFPITKAISDAASSRGLGVVIDGEGGDLFAASPLALLDLLARGSFGMLARAARGYRVFPRVSYGVQAKIIGRAISPPVVRGMWDRLRGRHASPRAEAAAFGANRQLINDLVALGNVGSDEVTERVLAKSGAELASPLLDLRVVRILLGTPIELRVPVDGYKPLLKRAFLRSLDGSRLKASHRPYYQALARSQTGDTENRNHRLSIARPQDPLLDSLRGIGPEAWRRWSDCFACTP
jgi:asparagine synthetase B (glutamine-hydrolysing)